MTSWGVRSTEQLQRDVVAALRERAAAGQSMSVRASGHSLYSVARRAFGSWSEALEAAGLDASRPGGDYSNTIRHLDAISPNQLEGLPPYMRQRQIIGGALLERVAEGARRVGDRSISDVSPGELRLALAWVLENERRLAEAEATR